MKNNSKLSSRLASASLLNRSGAHLHAVVGQELEAGNAAESGDVLVLLSHRFVSKVDFDVAGLLGKFLLRHHRLLVRVQRVQECRGERSRGTQARARRDVRHAGDLQAFGRNASQEQGFANERMAYLLRFHHALGLRVLDDRFLEEGVVQGDVDVFIDRCRRSRIRRVGGSRTASQCRRLPMKCAMDSS